jgi:hypothetical protein
MKRRSLWPASLVLLAAAVAAPLLLQAQSGPLVTRKNVEGNVQVSVTPQGLAKAAGAWRFAVQLTTHVTPLAEDMMAVASLDANDAAEKPTAWEGDGPGGHHRKGVLVFKPIDPMPAAVTLHIRQVGGIADRTFTWTLAPQ